MANPTLAADTYFAKYGPLYLTHASLNFPTQLVISSNYLIMHVNKTDMLCNLNYEYVTRNTSSCIRQKIEHKLKNLLTQRSLHGAACFSLFCNLLICISLVLLVTSLIFSCQNFLVPSVRDVDKYRICVTFDVLTAVNDYRCLLGHAAVWLSRGVPMFKRNLLPPSSG